MADITVRLEDEPEAIDGYRVIRDGLDGSETIVVEGIVRARPGSVVTPELIELPLIAESR